MNNFKLNDKIECVRVNCEALTKGKVYTVTGGTEYWVLVTNDRGTDSWYDPSRFKLYEEKEQMFDLKTSPWYISITNQAEFDAAQEWLKENFGTNLNAPYTRGVCYLTNTQSAGYPTSDRVVYGTNHPTQHTMRHEIKLSFVTKTFVDNVEWPELKTPEQKQLDIVMEQIKSLQKEAEKLQQVVTEASK